MTHVLTAEQMRLVDRRTIAHGFPSLVLMENAAHRVVEAMRERFGPLSQHRIRVYCGKGNNGGDGLAIARLLAVVDQAQVDVVYTTKPEELTGDPAAQHRMLRATRAQLGFALSPTLIVDALLGTGTQGPPRGNIAEHIVSMNQRGVPIVAVDHPSGLETDSATSGGPYVEATLTVTFTAPKICHVLPPNCDRHGELRVAQIGSDPLFCESDLFLSSPDDFARLFVPRLPLTHKGHYGHVLVIGGAPGKTGAAQMAGLAALRAGAGWVSVHSAAPQLPPELMTATSLQDLTPYTVLAVGPGLGIDPLAQSLYETARQAMVVDADALNTLAQLSALPPAAGLRVLTPHPGEMRRLQPQSSGDRLADARAYATAHQVILVLKGHRTLIAFPNGKVYVNPTGSPAMAKAGSGDILTGLVASLLAQHPQDPAAAVLAAVWLHGRAGEHAAQILTDRCVLATDLLTYLPHAIRDVQNA